MFPQMQKLAISCKLLQLFDQLAKAGQMTEQDILHSLGSAGKPEALLLSCISFSRLGMEVVDEFVQAIEERTTTIQELRAHITRLETELEIAADTADKERDSIAELEREAGQNTV